MPATARRLTPVSPLSRRELVRDAAIEAARRFVASVLVEERRGAYAVAPGVAEDLQELRDVLAVERRARGLL